MDGMKKSYQKNDAVAQKLRSLGYVPLPRLWVKSEELGTIIEIAKKHEERVTEVRRRVYQEEEAWKSK